MKPSKLFRRVLPGIAAAAVLVIAYRSRPALRLAQISPASGRKPAAEFSLRDSQGVPLRLSELKGKVVLLDFWETSCVPCRVEIPWLIEFQRAYGSRNFEVVGVSIDEEGWAHVKPFMKKTGINYRMALANDDIERAYPLEATPTTVLIDKSGRIAATHVGLIDKKRFEAEIKSTMAE